MIEVPPGLPKPADKKDPTVKTSLPLVLQRIHAKLESDVELYRLHLKHYHMSAEQFKRRTSALRIPAHIYDRYESMVKQCDTCQKSKVAPSRSRISGMRSEVFGELTFIDHGETPVSPTSKLVFLLIYDGATTLTTAYPGVERRQGNCLLSLGLLRDLSADAKVHRSRHGFYGTRDGVVLQ